MIIIVRFIFCDILQFSSTLALIKIIIILGQYLDSMTRLTQYETNVDDYILTLVGYIPNIIVVVT